MSKPTPTSTPGSSEKKPPRIVDPWSPELEGATVMPGVVIKGEHLTPEQLVSLSKEELAAKLGLVSGPSGKKP